MTLKTPEEERALKDQVRDGLEKLTQFRLALAEATIRGSTCLVLRPAEENSPIPTFNIFLSQSPRWVEASVEPDPFAGELVRDIGVEVKNDPSVWMSLIKESEVHLLKVEIRVNELPLELGDVSQESWHSLEIEVRKRVKPRLNDQALIDAWTDVAGSALCFVLSSVGVFAEDQFPPGMSEGGRMVSTQTKHERSPINRWRSIQHHGLRCWVCDLKFDELYGPLGHDFIEVHHLFPLAAASQERRVNPVTEMVPLCSNCHSMVHKETPPVHPQRLRQILQLPLKHSVLAEDTGC